MIFIEGRPLYVTILYFVPFRCLKRGCTNGVNVSGSGCDWICGGNRGRGSVSVAVSVLVTVSAADASATVAVTDEWEMRNSIRSWFKIIWNKRFCAGEQLQCRLLSLSVCLSASLRLCFPLSVSIYFSLVRPIQANRTKTIIGAVQNRRQWEEGEGGRSGAEESGFGTSRAKDVTPSIHFQVKGRTSNGNGMHVRHSILQD